MFKSLGDKYVYLIVLAVNILGFVTGTSISWSSPVLPKLTDVDLKENPLERVISDDESSWIGSLLFLGGAFSPFIYAFTIDKFGRKFSIIAAAAPFLTSYVILIFATNINLYYVARVLAGVGIGGAFTVMPIYIGEIAIDSKRGMLMSSTTCFIIAGILFAYVTGPYVSIMWFNIILTIFPILTIVLIMLLAPESPYFLLYTNKAGRAKKSLIKIRGSNDVDNELEEITLNISKVEKGSILDIFKSKAGIKAFIISCSLLIFQQFSGINVILSYTQDIFEATGTDIDSAVSSIISGAVQMATCVIVPATSHIFGRRTLLLFSVTGVTISQAAFGLYFFLKNKHYDLSAVPWLPIVVLVIYIIFFNSGFGALPSAITGELFPLNVKSVGCSLTISIYWLVGFVLTYFFNNITTTIGMGETFWVFSGVCLGAVAFIYFYVVETKGKSLQEIQDILNA